MLDYVTLLNKSTVLSDYLGEEVYNLLDKTFELPNEYSFNVFRVTPEYVARPDLISYDAYGDSMYADVVCKLNGISNPFELNSGMILVLPAPEDITNFHVKPSAAMLDAENGTFDSIRPTAKTRTDKKRKPNEAIIGSSRFKIDQSSGVVIY
jgi:hypothetical protein